MYKILIVDDEDSVRHWLRELLMKYGYEVLEASGGLEAIETVKTRDIDLVLLDVIMPGSDGLKILLDLKKIDYETPVIMVTGQSDIATAVQATKRGAFDFVTKPIEAGRLVETIQLGLERLESQSSLRQLQESLEWTFGVSPSIGPVIEQIRRAARGNGKIVIQGEPGTGKSIAARAIHNLSKKMSLPFQSILISRISEDCIDTALVHRNIQQTNGEILGPDGALLHSARGGTIFFDGMHNVSLAVQHRLVSILGQQTTNIHHGPVPFKGVRIMCATETDLPTLVNMGRLTRELQRYFDGQVIVLPPLREHKEDLNFLATKCLWEIAVEQNNPVKTLSNKALGLLMNHSWPGNARELKYIIRRAAANCDQDIITDTRLKPLLASSGTREFYLLPKIQKKIGGEERDASEPTMIGEQCYRQIVEQSPLGIFICRDGLIQYANHGLSKIIKATDPGELEGVSAFDIIDSRSHDTFKASLEKVLNGGQEIVQSELQIRYTGSVAAHANASVFACSFEGREAVSVVIEDITKRKLMEQELMRREADSREKTLALKDANAALNVLIEKKTDESESVKGALLANVRELVLPYLQRVRSGRLSESQLAYMDMIESNLNHITAPFVQKMKDVYNQLTPTEIQVADMIKNGKATKEIAELLNVCSGTVEGHRISIRKKLGLKNKGVNLQSYLSSL